LTPSIQRPTRLNFEACDELIRVEGDGFKGYVYHILVNLLIFRAKQLPGHIFDIWFPPGPIPPFFAHELHPQHHEVEFGLTHKANFSYTLHTKKEVLINSINGSTGTNVMDVRLFLDR
jgi:hypothetical protein